MKEITEEDAREALKYICGDDYEINLGYITTEYQKKHDLLSTLIARFFEMEKALKEIARNDFDAYACQKAQQALTGKKDIVK